MDALALLIYAAEWGLIGIILFFLIAWIPMPEWATRVAQSLLILIGVLAMLSALLGQPMRPISRVPNPPGPASIIK